MSQQAFIFPIPTILRFECPVTGIPVPAHAGGSLIISAIGSCTAMCSLGLDMAADPVACHSSNVWGHGVAAGRAECHFYFFSLPVRLGGIGCHSLKASRLVAPSLFSFARFTPHSFRVSFLLDSPLGEAWHIIITAETEGQ